MKIYTPVNWLNGNQSNPRGNLTSVHIELNLDLNFRGQDSNPSDRTSEQVLESGFAFEAQTSPQDVSIKWKKKASTTFKRPSARHLLQKTMLDYTSLSIILLVIKIVHFKLYDSVWHCMVSNCHNRWFDSKKIAAFRAFRLLSFQEGF